MALIKHIFEDAERHEATVVCDDETFLITANDQQTGGFFVGEQLTEERQELLFEAAQRLACIKKALDILSRSDLSKKKLQSKLCMKFPKELCFDVSDLLEKRGYINDLQCANRFAESFYVFRLWGPLRIKNELFVRGFEREVIAEVIAEYEERDHTENLTAVYKKNFGRTLPSDTNAVKKIYAKLLTMGYNSAQTRDFISKIIGDEVIWE